MDCNKVNLLSVSNLAFLGDAYYELMVRKKISSQTNMKSSLLHENSVKKVCAKSQALGYDYIKCRLNDKEQNILRRGKNSNVNRCPNNAKLIEYKKATGIETLFGYWYLCNEYNRAQENFDLIFNYLDEMIF